MKITKLLTGILGIFLSVSAGASCLTEIEQNKVDSIFEKCTDPKAMRGYVFYSGIGHEFGSIETPSPAASLIKQKAHAGEVYYEYLWGLILQLYSVDVFKANLLNPENRSQAMKDSINALENESLVWIIRARDQGLIVAMTKVVALCLGGDTPSPAVKAKAISYAQVMVENNIPGAESLLPKLQEKKTTVDYLAEYQNTLKNYQKLPLPELKNFAQMIRTGWYRPTQAVAIEVEQDKSKAGEIYGFLIEALEDRESGFILAQMVGSSDKKRALELYQWAARKGDMEAAAWLGEYHSCQNNLDLALSWLETARKLGNSHTDIVLEEIKEFGESANCRDGWIR